MAQSFYEPERFSIRSAMVRWFRGFKYRPQASWALLGWDACLIGAGLIAVWYGVIVPVIQASHIEASSADVQYEQFAVLYRALASLLLGMPVFLALALVSDVAWHRLLTVSQVKRPVPYRLGRDEGRAFAIYLMAWAIQTTFAVFLYIVLVVPMMVIIVLIHSGGGRPVSSDNASVTSFMVVALATLLGALFQIAINYVVIALHTGVPLAIKRQRFELFAGWRRTRPFRGRLLVASLIVGGFAMICAWPIQLIPSLMTSWLTEWFAEGVTVSAGLRILFGLALLVGGALYYLSIQAQRGVIAEAAMVSVTAETREAERLKAEASPPVSPDGPDPAPEAV